MTVDTLQKYDCDRCGFTYKKCQLKRQRGMLLCCDCFDNLKKAHHPKPRWGSPRDNSLSVDPVNEQTVFIISAVTGINFLGQSVDYDREGSRSDYFMNIVSDGGAISISASPQIVAATQGTRLTLRGTSDTNTIKIVDDAITHLIRDKYIVLGDGDTITFVYNEGGGTQGAGWGSDPWGQTGFGYGAADEGWVECSRYKGGL